MTPNDTTTLVHLVGFLAGVALYAMLGVMTVRGRSMAESPLSDARADRIPLATAVLGLVWNSVALIIYGFHDLGLPAPLPHAWPWIVALAFSALGFLPAVVVHSAVQSAGRRVGGRSLVASAYALSAVAAILQLIDAGRGLPLPSRAALVTLTVGYGILIGALVVYSRRQPGWRRALSAVALAAFAVMALHLSQHTDSADSWPTELVGHHASLPLALVILYQDYRFALADLFLKRALTLVALLCVTLGLYRGIAAPFIIPHLGPGSLAPGAVGALLGLWVLTALTYPLLRRTVDAAVDHLILRRADYRRLRASISSRVANLETEPEILSAVCDALRTALTARRVTWMATADPPAALSASAAYTAVTSPDGGQGAVIWLPTTDTPTYIIEIASLAAGRRLLSDDLAMLDAVGLIVARRIDAIRVVRERYGRDLREREILQLATEAQLTALRAQLNPHFLFNALTTIGYLMQEAPQRALDTLFRLTNLLRAVLKRSDGELATLGDELEIVRSYLAIEAARFEDRLSVTIDVPNALLAAPVPPLLLQPLVENAIKHGISPRKAGGQVMITARLSDAVPDGETSQLVMTVIDTGVGASPIELARGRTAGIGLANIESRLGHYYGTAATCTVRSAPGVGTTVEIYLPIPARSGLTDERRTVDAVRA
jgi:two-component system, LytTR family, sensor kinase